MTIYRIRDKGTGHLLATPYRSMTEATLILLELFPHAHDHYDVVLDTAGSPVVDPRCQWYRGNCEEPPGADTDGLCPFHFDACERPQHADVLSSRRNATM